MRTLADTIRTFMSEPSIPLDIGALARQYGRAVFHAAYRVLGDAAQCEDVQQDVFLRVLEANVADVDSWPAYLAALATRLSIDRLRRARRWRRLLPAWLVGAPAAAPPADGEALAAERAERLRAAMARLKSREAECFALRHVQGLEIAEIATTLGISANHVSVTLHRAVTALRRALDEGTEQVTEETR
jgi:RNA polymerase sigma-70 factor (ECF subfamily)